LLRIPPHGRITPIISTPATPAPIGVFKYGQPPKLGRTKLKQLEREGGIPMTSQLTRRMALGLGHIAQEEFRSQREQNMPLLWDIKARIRRGPQPLANTTVVVVVEHHGF